MLCGNNKPNESIARMARIQIDHVEKWFGTVQVLNDISLAIGDGEFVVLVGPSGCGKSTLLRIISGLEPASEGVIRIDDLDVTDLPAKSRDMAMVFQSYALYPHMTVADNMAFSLKVRGTDRATIDARVKAAAAALGLAELLDRKPAALSGGQRQRVAMGRAIVRDPKVFLFDEPLSNLDAKLRVSMRSEIKALHQRLKTTTVYVTHDQVEAMTMADRIVVMRAGIIEQIGTPLELYDWPVNCFVAEFIGSPSMNLITATLQKGAGKISARLNAGGNTFELPATVKGSDGQAITLGIRPEHVLPRGADNRCEVRVDTVESLGAQVQLVTELAGRPLTVLLNERLLPVSGSNFSVSFPAEHLHVFDAGTGLRLDSTVV